MDRDRFLRELEEIKNGRKTQNLVDSGTSVCNRLYSTLVECLAFESKNVEAKLQVLTSALCYYVDLRPHYDVTSPEADAFGHFLFMECSRLVLGIEFHHLKSDDSYKCAFKSAIGDVYRKLQDYAIGQVFLVLEWLMVNQWSHPTLVAMMKGEDIDKERALTYIRSGEYPELFRLRVEMLMESGCDNFASNLVSWCTQSPLFENDVPLRSTHLLLLHKLGRNEQLHSQCCQLSCCVAKEILRHLTMRSEEPSFLLLMTQTFLLLNWIKLGDFCCTKELLEFWLTVQHQGEPEVDKFLESINKVVVLTQDIRQITIFLEVMVSLFESKFIQFCTELALTSLRKERHRLDMARECHKDEKEIEEAAKSLAQICRLVAQLYVHHPQMHLACLLTILYLEPNDTNYFVMESYFQDASDVPSAEAQPPVSVDPHHYRAVLETVEALRPLKFHPKFGWKEVKLSALSHLEDAGYKFDPERNTVTGVLDRNTVGRGKVCFRLVKPVKVSAYEVSPGLHDSVIDGFCDGIVTNDLDMTRYGGANGETSVHFTLPMSIQDPAHILNELKSLDSVRDTGGGGGGGGGADRWSSNGRASSLPLSQLSSHKLVALSEDSSASIYQQQALSGSYPLDGIMSFPQLSGHPSVTSKMHAGFTLDDIQQVLSATQTSCDGSSTGGTDIPMDERKLREITAFLLGRHPDGMTTTFPVGVYPPAPPPPPPTHPPVGSTGGATVHPSGGRHQADAAPGSSCASSSVAFTSVESVLPQTRSQSDDMQFNIPSSYSSSSSSSSSASSSSCGSSTSSQKEAFSLGRVTGQPAMVLPPNAFSASANCLGSTILVTESNLPYLQQFLPNLQTVMQSVQSLVRGVPSQNDKPSNHLIHSTDNSTSSSDMLQEVPNVTMSSFGGVSPAGPSSAAEHESPHKLIRMMDPKMSVGAMPGGYCSPTLEMVLDKVEDLSDDSLSVQEDSFPGGDGILRSKEKSRKESDAAADKFYCRFCRRGFPTIAQRRRHVEWKCQKKKAVLPTTAQVGASLKCELCGKTFVSKSGHTTHMMRVHGNQTPQEAATSDSDTASSGVRLPDDVTLRDCFVKIVRMDNGCEGDSEEGVDRQSGKAEEEGNDEGAGPKEDACMCDSCGEILSGYDRLTVHLEHCNVTLPAERGVAGERPRTVGAEGGLYKQGDTFSVMTVNPNGQQVAYCSISGPDSMPAPDGLQPRLLVAEHGAYFVQKPGQLSALAVPGSACVKQGAMIEMLQVAEHFLKNSLFVTGNAGASKGAFERHAETVVRADLRPKVEPGLAPTVMTTSRFVPVQQQQQAATNAQKQNHLLAEPGHLPITVAYSQLPNKRVAMTTKATGAKCEALSGFVWPKSESEKLLPGASLFQSNLKPDVIMDGCLSVGKEIVYEGTRMHEYVEYQCETCLLTFNESASANAHIEGSDHGNSSVASYHVYVCTSCSIKYRDKQVMRNHILYICTGSHLTSLAPSQQQRELHRCGLCTKAFISSDFLQTHLNLKHGVKSKELFPNRNWSSNKTTMTAPADASSNQTTDILTQQPGLADGPGQSEVSCAGATLFRKWSSGDSVQVSAVSAGPSPPYLFATPSAVSIPTLEQLTSGYGKTPNDTKDVTKFPDLAASHQSPDVTHPVGGGSVPDILASIPEHGDIQKQVAGVAAGDARQLILGAQGAGLKQRSSKAKGILYKNVFMQCEGTYFCSVCKADLSTRESKKNHRQMPCGDPRTITYSRKYSYLCPYCMERFPSQKTCRQHQVSECLPLIGISTEELSVKELICPLCPKKYFNLIPLKGHMTQVHKLPKAETRDMLHRLGYMEPSVADGSQGKAPSSADGGVLQEGIIKQHKLSPADFVSGDHTNSTDVEFVQRSILFDFENDVSSECAVQGQDVLIQNNCEEQCPEMEVIYDAEIFIDHEDKKLKDGGGDLAGAEEEMEISSAMLGADETRLGGFGGGEKSSSLGMEQYLTQWPEESGQLSGGGGGGALVVKGQSYLQETMADSTVSPEQRRRKPRQTNEFFVMMFRNYPILAKGVSVCAGCQAQMSSNSEVDSHISSAVCTGPDGRPADVKRSTIFKCTHCDKTFWKAKTCRQHQLDTCLPLHGVEVDNLVQPSVACPLCAAKSYNRSGLMSHMKYKHGMDTKGVRDIMEQYGIHKKTAELVVPSLTTASNCVVGGGARVAMSSGGVDCVEDPAGTVVDFEKSLDLDGNEKLYALEGVGSMHFIGADNPASVVGDSCSAQFGGVKTNALGSQYEAQRLYSAVSTLSKDREHGNVVGTASFNSVT